MKHTTHPDIIKRLKQAHGHLATVIAMLEQGRPCVELAQQVHAVESTIHKAKRILIEDHLQHCLGDGLGGGDVSGSVAMTEFKALSKYL